MIPVIELFGNTIQGEGSLIGRPAVFVRTFGCNLNCAGFGMPNGELSTEADEIMKSDIGINAKDIKELPLAKTGCDSYPAIHPLCARFAKRYEVQELADAIAEKMEGYKRLVVFTGGEPLLHQSEIAKVIELLKAQGITDFMFETNGTIEFHEIDALKEPGITIHFSVSPKLSVSGNPFHKAFNPSAVYSYIKYGPTYLKFVVAKEDDVIEVHNWLDSYRDELSPLPIQNDIEVFLMPEGGVLDKRSQDNAKRVAELCWKHNMRFSPREHLTVFGNAWAK